MFISRADKDRIEQNIRGLMMSIERLNNEIVYLTARIKLLEGSKQEPKKKRTMSPEGRAKMSQIMKERHAKNKLEKENGNSISTKG